MFSRREFTLLFLSMGFSNRLWATADAIALNYTKYQKDLGVSDSGFSFENRALALPNKILKLNDQHFCVMNFKSPSWQERFSIVNKNADVELSSIASHGINTGNSLSWDFSNLLGSFKSSPGIYVTGAHYIGRFGPSILLHGVSATNSNVAKRSIVLHGANYCNQKHIDTHGFLGRSLGCIALTKTNMIRTFQILKPGTMIFTESTAYPTKPEILMPATREEIEENKITLLQEKNLT